MRNVLSMLALCCICLLVGFGTTGCAKKVDKPKDPAKVSLGDRVVADKEEAVNAVEARSGR